MVHMVDADIAGEPLQHFWQGIIRTAVKGGAFSIPLFFMGPVGIFKLMLDVKQPDASGA